MGDGLVEVTLELSREEAYALAELTKRAGFSDVRSLSVDEAEAYSMIHALDQVRDALAASGVSVR